MSRVFAVVLAAGASRRLGSNKLTLKIDGEAVIRKATLPFLSVGIVKVIVVTGASHEGVRRELADCADAIEFVTNCDSLLGMSTSVRAAMPYLAEAEGVFFHLGDKPFLEPEMLTRMMSLYEADRTKIILPSFKGKMGHPVLMDVRPYAGEIECLGGDRGLREVIDKHRENVIFIEGNEGSLFDIDTVEELHSLRERGYSVEEG